MHTMTGDHPTATGPVKWHLLVPCDSCHTPTGRPCRTSTGTPRPAHHTRWVTLVGRARAAAALQKIPPVPGGATP